MPKVKTGNIASIVKKSKDRSNKDDDLIIVKYEESKSQASDFFDTSMVQKAVSSSEINTGITNDSPEIVLFSDFIPVYDDQGNLNNAGQVFQAKQVSILVSADSSIKSMLFSGSSAVFSAADNKREIYKFCSNFGGSIDSVFNSFSLIKEKFNCRSKIEDQDLKSIGAFPVNSTNSLKQGSVPEDFSPSKIEEILHDDNFENIKNWSLTKLWIQTVLELKEGFRNGLFNSLLTNVSFFPQIDMEGYKSPYWLFSPMTEKIKKFNFSEVQPIVPSIKDFSDLATATVEGIDSGLQILKPIFNVVGSTSNIFNQSLLHETKPIEVSIAQLSHAVCREYVYSTKFDQQITNELYGYNLKIDGTGNLEIWDYLFGQTGNDITDIIPNPLGGGNSLISLSQFVEADGTEVLTFEDSYIKDDVSTSRSKRLNISIVPGMHYYIESSINLDVNKKFDTTRISSYIERQKSAIKMLEMLKNNLVFKTDVFPYSTPENKQKSISTGTNKNQNSSLSLYQKITDSRGNSVSEDLPRGGSDSDIKDYLSNPILFLRHLEQKILSNSELLSKQNSKSNQQTLTSDLKLWSNTNSNFPEDISWLLISAAIDFHDSELLSLLFLYCTFTTTDQKTMNIDPLTTGNSSTNYKFSVSEKIVARLRSLISNNSISSTYKNQQSSILMEEDFVLQCLNGTLPNGTKILNSISLLMKEILDYFEKLENSKISNYKKLFFSVPDSGNLTINSRRYNKDKRTLYSGIQKTVYISAIFDLCCLLVHAANPERVVNYEQGTSISTPSFNVDYSNLGGLVSSNELFTEPTENSVVGAGFKISKVENVESSIFKFSKILVKVENSLYEYNKEFIKKINRVYGFCVSLNRELQSFKEKLENDPTYAEFLFTIKSFVKDTPIANMLMTNEQLLLARSKMFDIVNRSSENYSCPIKETLPYFLQVKNDANINALFPVEDTHLVSWNVFLKDFFSKQGFFESDGFNKKIISVGIPQKMHRQMYRLLATDIASFEKRNKLIKINIYKINEMIPELVYKPLSFLFDLEKYPTRILKNYIDSGFSLSNNKNYDFKNFPILNIAGRGESSTTSNFILKKISESFNQQSFLSENNKKSLTQNHIVSFFLEEYLAFTTGLPFDEQSYNRYSTIKESIISEFAKYVNNSLGVGEGQPINISSTSLEDYFSNNTYFTSENNIKTSLVTPKKFDRVFHMIFDPDDFEIDSNLTENAEKYENIVKSTKDRISFDRYFTSVEIFDVSAFSNSTVSSLTGNILLI